VSGTVVGHRVEIRVGDNENTKKGC